MSLEAMWTMEPFMPDGTAGLRGIVVLETGRLLGGDHGSVYVGDWKFEGGRLKFRAHVTHYADDVVSLVAPHLRELDYVGDLPIPDPNATHFRGQIQIEQVPGISIRVEMRRVAELP